MNRARERRWRQYSNRISPAITGMITNQVRRQDFNGDAETPVCPLTPEQMLAFAVIEQAFIDLTDRSERGKAWAFLRSEWAAYLWDNLDFDAPLPLVLEHLSGVMPGGWAV